MTRYDPAGVKSYYHECGEKEWERWDGSPVEQIKFGVRLYYLRRYLEKAGVIVEIPPASDCLSATWAEHLNTLQEDRDAWQHLLEMEMVACCKPGCLDMGTHLIAVCSEL